MAAVQNLYTPTCVIYAYKNHHFQIPIRSWNAQAFLPAISISTGMDLAKSLLFSMAFMELVTTVRVLHKTQFDSDKDNWEMAY